VKQGNLTSDDEVNGRVWRLKTSNRWTTGKLIYSYYLSTKKCWYMEIVKFDFVVRQRKSLRTYGVHDSIILSAGGTHSLTVPP